MVVRIKRDGHLVLAKGKGADMVPGAINTPELDPVHIDMGVTMPLDILQPSRFGVEGEVSGDDIEIPAGSRVAVDSCIERRPGGCLLYTSPSPRDS